MSLNKEDIDALLLGVCDLFSLERSCIASETKVWRHETFKKRNPMTASNTLKIT